jgi:hypothetical protein
MKRWRHSPDIAGTVLAHRSFSPASAGVGGLGRVFAHELPEPVQVGAGAGQVARVLEVLEEVVIEEEHPDVPVRDRVEHGAVAVRMGVGAHQRVVHRGQRGLVPDQAAAWLGRVEHALLAGPRGAVLARPVEVRIAPRRIRQVKRGKLECLHVVTLALRVIECNS